MRHTRFYAAVIALGILTGVGLATTTALAQPGASEPTIEEVANDADFDAFWAEVQRTGLLPIGVNATGDGPFGYVDVDKAVVVAGKAHGDLKVFDAKGAHIGWAVHGLEPMSVAAYEADPAGHRAAGAARVAELTGVALD